MEEKVVRYRLTQNRLRAYEIVCKDKVFHDNMERRDLLSFPESGENYPTDQISSSLIHKRQKLSQHDQN